MIRRVAFLTILIFLVSPFCMAAFTELYVSVAGSGDSSGSSPSNALTLAEALADTTAGSVRYNIIAGSYTSGAASVAQAGDNQSSRIYRGYNSVIGDLVGERTGANGKIIVTNYPVITLTGSIAPGVNVYFEALKFQGSALSSYLVGSTSVDTWGAIHCVFVNSTNNAAAYAVRSDNDCEFFNCDFECSGAAHAEVVQSDSDNDFYNCRFKTTANNCLNLNFGTISRCVFYGYSSGIAMRFDASVAGITPVLSNTIYGMDIAISLPAAQVTTPLKVVNNFVSDCSEFIDSLYVGTANQPVIEINNWLYNVTTARTGVSDFPISREITGSGTAGVYFENAAGEDFNLTSSAPGYGAGLWPYSDIGAFQALRSGGGGGDKWPFPGMERVGD